MKSAYQCQDFKSGVKKFELCSKNNHVWFHKKEDISQFKELLLDWILENRKISEKVYKNQVTHILNRIKEKVVCVDQKQEPKKLKQLKPKKSVIAIVPKESDLIEHNNRMLEKSVGPSIKSAISTDALAILESRFYNKSNSMLKSKSKDIIFKTDRQHREKPVNITKKLSEIKQTRDEQIKNITPIKKKQVPTKSAQKFVKSKNQQKSAKKIVQKLNKERVKFYDTNGKQHYDGEIFNGFANGTGCLYFSNGTKEYDGDFKYNLLGGNGKQYDKDGFKVYEGEFVEGKKCGYGIGFYKSGEKNYEGKWEGDKWNGYGAWYNVLGDVICEGLFSDGKPKDPEYYLRDNPSKLLKDDSIFSKEGQQKPTCANSTTNQQYSLSHQKSRNLNQNADTSMYTNSQILLSYNNNNREDSFGSVYKQRLKESFDSGEYYKSSHRKKKPDVMIDYKNRVFLDDKNQSGEKYPGLVLNINYDVKSAEKNDSTSDFSLAHTQKTDIVEKHNKNNLHMQRYLHKSRKRLSESPIRVKKLGSESKRSHELKSSIKSKNSLSQKREKDRSSAKSVKFIELDNPDEEITISRIDRESSLERQSNNLKKDYNFYDYSPNMRNKPQKISKGKLSYLFKLNNKHN